jgi:hypothetical protein
MSSIEIRQYTRLLGQGADSLADHDESVEDGIFGHAKLLALDPGRWPKETLSAR